MLTHYKEIVFLTFLNAVEVQVAVVPGQNPQVTAEESALAASKMGGWKVPIPWRGTTIKTPKTSKNLEDFRTTALCISKIGNTNHHGFQYFSTLYCVLFSLEPYFQKGAAQGGYHEIPMEAKVIPNLGETWRKTKSIWILPMQNPNKQIHHEIMSCAWMCHFLVFDFFWRHLPGVTPF